MIHGVSYIIDRQFGAELYDTMIGLNVMDRNNNKKDSDRVLEWGVPPAIIPEREGRSRTVL